MISNLLWYQSPKKNEEDRLYVDGTPVKPGTRERVELFGKLKKLADKAVRYKAPWCGFVGGTFFMKGFFAKKDDYGRKTAFMFATEAKDYETILKKVVSSIGMDMDTQSVESLSHARKPVGNAIVIALITAIIIIIAAIIYGTRN